MKWAAPLWLESMTARCQIAPHRPAQRGHGMVKAPPPHSPHFSVNSPLSQSAPQLLQEAMRTSLREKLFRSAGGLRRGTPSPMRTG
jgi:hypothetical protein